MAVSRERATYESVGGRATDENLSHDIHGGLETGKKSVGVDGVGELQ